MVAHKTGTLECGRQVVQSWTAPFPPGGATAIALGQQTQICAFYRQMQVGVIYSDKDIDSFWMCPEGSININRPVWEPHSK